MPNVEIDQAQLALYTRAQSLLDGLYSDPDVGMEFKSMLKKKFPKLSIPEVDAAETQNKALDALRKEFGDYRKKQEDDKLEADYSKRFQDVRSEFQLTDEGVEEVKKRMVKESIADPRAAAALVVHEKPKAVESNSFGTTRWDFFGSQDKDQLDDIKALVADPDAWLDQQIPKILAEERNKARLPVTV